MARVNRFIALFIGFAWALAGCEQGQIFGTDLRRKSYSWERDTDRDGISDRQEVASRLDPYDASDAVRDDDGDGLTNYWEARLGFDPYDSDSGKGRQVKNGIRDGDEDLNGDGVPIGWEILHDIDPLGADNRLADSDHDGYANAEEYAHGTSPQDPAAHPGAAIGILVYGATLGRTNSIFVRVTANWCGPNEWALVTGSAGRPNSDDARWVPCSTAEQALAGMLASTVEGQQVVYLWRRNAIGLIEYPIAGNIIYDVTPPQGDLEATASQRLTIELTHTPPVADDFADVALTRYGGEQCQGDGTSLAIEPQDLTISDRDLPFGIYCYEIAWRDTAGNTAKQQVIWPDPKDSVGPLSGSLSVQSITHAGNLTLAVTTPQDPDLASMSVRRYPGQGCSNAAESDGVAIASQLFAATLTDIIPDRLTPYCYKAFWRDLRGNIGTADVTYPDPADSTPPAGGSLLISDLIAQGIKLMIVQPTDVDYARIALRRYEAGTCADALVTQGHAVPVTTSTTLVTDTGLALGTPFCYKVFWYDTNGNLASSTTVYSANGPIPGSVTITDVKAQELDLTLSLPTDSIYSGNYEIRRYTELICDTVVRNAGGLVTAAPAATHVADTGLALATPYCYRVFWFDKFGNASASVVDNPYPGTQDTGSLAISGFGDFGTTGSRSILLSHTPPTNEYYDTLEIKRFENLNCSDIENGTLTPSRDALLIPDSNLSLGKAYCYKAFWFDLFGNSASAAIPNPYDGSGPSAGQLEISGFGEFGTDGSKTIELTHTPSTDPVYVAVALRRFEHASCEGAVSSVQLAVDDTEVVDSNLSLGKPYCYQVYWYDTFGNYSIGVVSQPYLGAGPEPGSIRISGFGSYETATHGSRKIVLEVQDSTDVNAAALKIMRYDATSCETSALQDGQEVSVGASATTVEDTGLQLATPYCYKAFWFDTFGNISSAVVPQPYAATGPLGGSIAVASRTESSLTLSHTPPTSAEYAAVKLRRVKDSACTAITGHTAGTEVTLDQADLSVTSSGLDADTHYCFKAFWFDTFGNITTAQPTGNPIPSKTLAVGCCWNEPQQTTWYLGNSVNDPVHAMANYGFDYGATPIVSVEDNGSPNPRPIFLQLGTNLPATSISINGSPSSTLASTTWSILINGTHVIQASSRVIAWEPPYTDANYTVPVDLFLQDNTPSDTAVSILLDSAYDGTNAVLKPLLGDADIVNASPDTSNGQASMAASDIPGLVYGDANCETLSQPKVCVQTSHYDQEHRTVNGGFDLLWDYSKFDHGRYDLVTLPYVNVDGARLYDEAQKTTVTVENPVELSAIHEGSAIGESQFFNRLTWANHRPSLALNENLSTSQSQVYGIVFPSYFEQANQFFGTVRLDHIQDAAYSSISDSNNSYRLSDGASTESMSVVSTDASSAEFVVASSVVSVSGGYDLVLRQISLQADGNLYTPYLNTKHNISKVEDSTWIKHIALTPAFADHASADPSNQPQRHGMVFFGVTDSGVADVYVSKIRSRPNPTDQYFDAAGFYQTVSNPISDFVPSVPVTGTDLSTTLVSMLRIVHSYEETHDYFYLGWRKDSVGKIYFSRVQADVNTPPVAMLTKANDEVLNSSPSGSDSFGRPAYELAVGKDSQGNRVLGVLFVENVLGSGRCKFRAYKVATELEKTTSSDLFVGNSTDCRFPSLFWNSDSNQFMAMWVNGPSGATQFAEFKLDLTNPAASVLSPANPNTVEITRPRTDSKKVCNFVAHYSPTHSATTQRRLAALSIETIDCMQNNVGGEMHLDVYRPGR